jgi:outer membrane lipoprotein-sorting protein
MHRRIAAALFCAAPLLSAASLDPVLARMDQTALTFKSMSAKIRQVAHTAVINEDAVSEGTVHLKRSKRDVQFLADFTSPDPKNVALSGTKVEFYLPKSKVVQEYDLGKVRIEKFLALGFGASGKELREDYTLREIGSETVNGQKTLRVELIPKSREVLQQFPSIELWISEDKGYPVQEKFHQTGDDYQTVVYSDVVINPPLPDSAYKLDLPKGVKREFPLR